MRALGCARPVAGARSMCRAVPGRRRAATAPSGAGAARARRPPGCARHARRRLAIALAVVALTAVAPSGPAGARAAAAACGSAVPGHASTAALRRAMRCVLARERRRHGLAPPRTDLHLGRAAMVHAMAMIRGHAFSHGNVLVGRVRAAGFAGHIVGEALAWGCADGASAAATMASWLRSPQHRAIVLGPGWRMVGVGVVAGTPSNACADGGTWVLEVGR